MTRSSPTAGSAGFVLLDLTAAGAGVVVLVVVLLAWSLRLYRAGRVDAAVLTVYATFRLQLVVAPLLVPSLFGASRCSPSSPCSSRSPTSSVAPSSSSRSRPRWRRWSPCYWR